MPETILITGVAGFIGSHVASAFMARGDRVVGLDNFDPFYDRRLKQANIDRIRELEFHEADVRDETAMRRLVDDVGPDGIVHLAALAGVRPSVAAPARFVEVNVGGLTSVLEAARAAAVPRFIFSSSSSVYGGDLDVPFAEDGPLGTPLSPYAATKRAGELLCQTYGGLYGSVTASLRFFTTYGPGQRPDLAFSRFMRLIADGAEIPVFGDGSTSRDYTYVDDIVSGVLAAYDRLRGERPGFYRTWNLGTGRTVTLREAIKTLGRVLGMTPRIRREPKQPGDMEHTYADSSRSRRELGFDPGTSLEEGLRHQWRWIQMISPGGSKARQREGSVGASS